MRLRAIYFRDRRVLVVIGKKKIAPHSIFDVFGASLSDADFGEIASGRTTAHLALSEAKSGFEIDQENNALVTSRIVLPVLNGGIGIEQKADADARIVRFGNVHGDILANNDTKALPTESVLASVNSGISASNETPALATESVFDKAESGIGTISSSDAIKTDVSKFDDAQSGMASSENNSTFNTDSPIYGKAEESIDAGENVEGIITINTPTIFKGYHHARNGLTASDVKAMTLNLPFWYQDTYDRRDSTIMQCIIPLSGSLLTLADSDNRIFGRFYSWNTKITLNTNGNVFFVKQDTQVTKEQRDLFYTYFEQ